MTRKRVLLIGGNYKPELTGIGKYNGEMIDWLAGQGAECSVITTYPYYPEWNINPAHKSKRFWFSSEKTISKGNGSVKICRCPHYIPTTPTGLKRMISDLSFMITASVRLIPMLFQRRYDYVMAVAPPFHVGLLALLYKWFSGAKMIYHIQDLQIDAAKELGMIKQPLLLKLMFAAEKLILKKTDHLSSISLGMIRKINKKTDRNVIFFPNWVNTKEFFPLTDKAGIKEKFGLDPASKIVMYAGAIGEKQGLEHIIRAAQRLQNEKIQFVICGNGPYRTKLEALKNSLKLKNVLFYPLQPKEEFNAFLNAADLHLVLQKKNANDLVMPSKLTGILSVGGVALVTAPADSGLHRYISENGIALLAEPEELSALIKGINIGLYGQTEIIARKARRFATTDLNIDHIMSNFMNAVSLQTKVPSVHRGRIEVVSNTQIPHAQSA